MKKTNTGALLETYLREKKYSAAYGLLRRIDKPISGLAANIFLRLALDCTPRMFGTLLDSCAPGEYEAEAAFQDVFLDSDIYVKGSCLTVAAAMGREEHVRLLLERGWDSNGEAPLAHSDVIICPIEDDMGSWMPPRPRTPLSGSVLLMARNNDGFSSGNTWRTLLIDYCTPLAAAIVCGQEECARLLWDYPGVRRLEEPSVSRAVAYGLNPVTKNEDGSFSIYSRPFFLPGLLGGSDSVLTFCDDMVPLLLNKDLKPSAFVDLYPPELLALMYDKGICGPEEARRVVQALDPDNPRWSWVVPEDLKNTDAVATCPPP